MLIINIILVFTYFNLIILYIIDRRKKMVIVYLEYCNVYIYKNSLWKLNKSDKHINNLRYEQIDN